MKDGDKFVELVNRRNILAERVRRALYLYELFSMPEYIMEVNYSKN